MSISRGAEKRAKKIILKGIHNNLREDNEKFKSFYKCNKNKCSIKYSQEKQEFKELYKEIIKDNYEKLLLEKERIDVKVKSISLPYDSMIIALILATLPSTLLELAKNTFIENNVLPKKTCDSLTILLIVLYMLLVIMIFSYLIISMNKEARMYLTCAEALKELEKEMLGLDKLYSCVESSEEVVMEEQKKNIKNDRAKRIKERLK